MTRRDGEAPRPKIRRAGVADAEGIAWVHVAASAAAYRGLLPADRPLPSTQTRHRQWRSFLADRDPRSVTFVLDDGRVCGFARAGPSRDPDAAADTGELYVIYLLPGYWRRGLGTALQQRTLEELGRAGFGTVTLWVLGGNAAARRFYERTGWRHDGQVKAGTADMDPSLRELRYRRTLVHRRQPRQPVSPSAR